RRRAVDQAAEERGIEPALLPDHAAVHRADRAAQVAVVGGLDVEREDARGALRLEAESEPVGGGPGDRADVGELDLEQLRELGLPQIMGGDPAVEGGDEASLEPSQERGGG